MRPDARVYYSLISTYMGPALSYNAPAAALIAGTYHS